MSLDFKVDRTAFSVVPLSESDDEQAYWLLKTPQERLRAVEFIRQAIYGYTPATGRLQRVFEVAQLEETLKDPAEAEDLERRSILFRKT